MAIAILWWQPTRFQINFNNTVFFQLECHLNILQTDCQLLIHLLMIFWSFTSKLPTPLFKSRMYESGFYDYFSFFIIFSIYLSFFTFSNSFRYLIVVVTTFIRFSSIHFFIIYIFFCGCFRFSQIDLSTFVISVISFNDYLLQKIENYFQNMLRSTSSCFW